MHIDWWTVGLQAVNILVLVWLFGKFLFPRVMVIMQERQAKAHALLQEAGDLRAAAEQEKAQAEEMRLATLAERTRILAAAGRALWLAALA